MDGFALLAEPARRRILDLLRQDQADAVGGVGHVDGARQRAGAAGLDVTTLVEALGLPQPLVSKHLRVLRESGAVTVLADGRRRVYRLAVDPLREVLAWVEPYRH
jgi:DNA-binding transcriptional ArsR family regulator